MNKSPLSRSSLSPRNLVVKPFVEEEAAWAAFLTLPQLVVDRSNFAATTQALADRFAIAGGLYQHGEAVDPFAHVDEAQRQMHLYVRRKQRRHATVSASVISMATNAGGASSCFHRRRTRPSIP